MTKILSISSGLFVKVILFLLLILGDYELYCSMIFTTDSMPKPDITNIYNMGFNKNANINYFNSELIYHTSIYRTDFIINNRFHSTVINSINNDYRDANDLSILINHPIYSNISLGLQNRVIYNSDSKSLTNNKLIDISIIPLLGYRFSNSILTDIGIGADYNQRADIVSNATAMQVRVMINQLSYNEYVFDSDLYYKILYFDYNRANQIVKANTKISASYSVEDRIELGINYNLNDKDFINYINNSPKEYLFERNSDNYYAAKLNIQYRTSKNSHLNSYIEYNAQFKDRYFNSINESIPNSMFRRNSQLTKVLLSNSISFKFNDFSSLLLFDYEANEELFNSKAQSQSIPSSLVASYQNIQKLNDYNSSRIRIALINSFALGRKDSLTTNLSAWLFRYNTPHKDNNDEYDVSYSSAHITYKHLFNQSFSFFLTGEVKSQHYVYINSVNSAQSNKLKSIKLKPEILYSNKVLYYNPRLEVLANYHIYDFQAQVSSLNTYSFRQITYMDSTSLLLNEIFSISSNILCRYSIRSNLRWESFAENPLKGNLEQIYRIMINNKFDIYSFGLGLGYYKVEQIDIVKQFWSNISTIISPEVLIGIKFSNNGTLLFFGKYDFQRINNLKRQVANISMQTTYTF